MGTGADTEPSSQQLAGDELISALQEVSVLYQMSARLSAATTAAEVLAVLREPGRRSGSIVSSLGLIETDKDGKPAALCMLAANGQSADFATQMVGQRFDLAYFPIARLWMESPGEPVLFGDVDADPRCDDTMRASVKAPGGRAWMLLPLSRGTRWIGLISSIWPTPQPFDETDRRVLRSIAKQAAVILDNILLAEHNRAALAENQRQREELQAILDNLPVGVAVLKGSDLSPRLVNRKCRELAGTTGSLDVSTEDRPLDGVLCAVGTAVPIDRSELPSRRARAQRECCGGEFDLVRSDGQRTTLELTAAPILDERGEVTSVLSVIWDASGRRHAEQERAAVQQELIQTQAALLAERGSPLIPITDDILVMPLIGAVDAERGRQLIDTLLQGVSHSQARVAILDITGVRSVDTSAASALTSAAQALRLLGVEAVLTGIRAEVAQTLVSLGVSLQGITTRATLQSGIAYAQKRLRPGAAAPER